jgi:hypothetical protein
VYTATHAQDHKVFSPDKSVNFAAHGKFGFYSQPPGVAV